VESLALLGAGFSSLLANTQRGMVLLGAGLDKDVSLESRDTDDVSDGIRQHNTIEQIVFLPLFLFAKVSAVNWRASSSALAAWSAWPLPWWSVTATAVLLRSSF